MSPTTEVRVEKGIPTIARRDAHGGWVFQFNRLPPSVNEMYENDGKGGKVLSADARSFVKDCTTIRGLVKFRPRLDRCYLLFVWFTVPDWSHDIDNRVKVLQDGLWGARNDHRIVRESINKIVEPGHTWTLARVVELPAGWVRKATPEGRKV